MKDFKLYSEFRKMLNTNNQDRYMTITDENLEYNLNVIRAEIRGNFEKGKNQPNNKNNQSL